MSEDVGHGCELCVPSEDGLLLICTEQCGPTSEAGYWEPDGP